MTLSDATLKFPMQLEKVYEPQRLEPHWAQWWIESGIYHVEASQAGARPVFSLVIPPPNVTGSLHIGHMLDHTIMDVAVRCPGLCAKPLSGFGRKVLFIAANTW